MLYLEYRPCLAFCLTRYVSDNLLAGVYDVSAGDLALVYERC